jgi:hypothetical protein
MKEINMQRLLLKLGSVFIVFFILLDLNGQTDQAKSLPQFLFPSFTKGILKMKDGRILSAVLNYNTVDEEMLFLQQGVYMVVDKPEEIDTIYLQNMKFTYVPKAFYQVVVKGRLTIFIENKSHYTPAGTTTAYGITSQTLGPTSVLSMQSGNQIRNIELPSDVTVAHANVNWAMIDGKMNKFQNERQFLKLFPGSETVIKEFIKKSGIDFKTTDGLAKLGTFCNGLQK